MWDNVANRMRITVKSPGLMFYLAPDDSYARLGPSSDIRHYNVRQSSVILHYNVGYLPTIALHGCRFMLLFSRG